MDKAWNVIATLNAAEGERTIADVFGRARWDEFFLKKGAYETGAEDGEAKGRLSERQEFARVMLAAGKPRAEILLFSRLVG